MAEQKQTIGKRILLVEDDAGARDSIKLLLRIDRHEVVEANGGAEAIELLGNKQAAQINPRNRNPARPRPVSGRAKSLGRHTRGS